MRRQFLSGTASVHGGASHAGPLRLGRSLAFDWTPARDLCPCAAPLETVDRLGPPPYEGIPLSTTKAGFRTNESPLVRLGCCHRDLGRLAAAASGVPSRAETNLLGFALAQRPP